MSEQRSEKVSLGCGTLILIALIVLIFSGGSEVKKLGMRIDTLTDQVIALEKKIDQLAQSVGPAKPDEAEVEEAGNP